MTIPVLIQKSFEKHAVSKLKETQSILSQAFKMAEEEYGDVEGWGLIEWNSVSAVKVMDNIKPFLKIALDCGLADTEGKCVPADYKLLNEQMHDILYKTDERYYKISLLNGSSVWWRTAKEADALIYFWIDINGKSLPNTFGKDLFMFMYAKNSIQPNGSPYSVHNAKDTCTFTGSGFGCAYYLIMHGNMNYLH